MTFSEIKVYFIHVLLFSLFIIIAKCQDYIPTDDTPNLLLIGNDTVEKNITNDNSSKSSDEQQATTNLSFLESNEHSTNIHPRNDISDTEKDDNIAPPMMTAKNVQRSNAPGAKNVFIQKCCGENQVFVNKKCTDYHNLYIYCDIYETNDTHYWLMDDYQIQINNVDPCHTKFEPLLPVTNKNDSDYWILLENGSIYFTNSYEFWDLSTYCLDTLGNNSDVLLYFCGPNQIKQGQLMKKYLQGSELAVSAVCLISLVIYKFNKRNYPVRNGDVESLDCKKCFLLMLSAMALQYTVWSLSIFFYRHPLCNKILWVCRFYFTLNFHCCLLFFYLQLVFNVRRIERKKRKEKIRYYAMAAFTIPLLICALFFGVLQDVPPGPIEERTHLAYGTLLYYLCYYVPCGCVIVACGAISVWLLISQISTTKPPLGVLLKQLERQNSRPLDAGFERMFYRKCQISIVYLFIFYLVYVISFSISVYYENQVAVLDHFNYVSYLQGLWYALFFLPNCQKLCGQNDDQQDLTNHHQLPEQMELIKVNNGPSLKQPSPPPAISIS